VSDEASEYALEFEFAVESISPQIEEQPAPEL
jgi:hypothetical protein